MLLLQILIAWLLADFVTGLIHWIEDKYMDAVTLKFWARDIAADNDLHHSKPTAMLLNSYWDNMRSGAIIGWPIAAMLFWIDAPLWLSMMPFFAAFGNLVHRFSHTPVDQLPRWIRGMQEFGLFISHQQHDAHHRSMKRLIPKHLAGYKFCPMTDWVNPILDRVEFWKSLERILTAIGIQPIAKPDHSS